MQVSNIEITVSNEIAQVLVAQVTVETAATVRFTDLQVVGGGSTCQW